MAIVQIHEQYVVLRLPIHALPKILNLYNEIYKKKL